MMSRRSRLIFASCFASCAIAVLALVWLDGPVARQRRGIEAARLLKQQLQPRLDADPRFASVRMFVETTPALIIHGTVATEKALNDLKSMVVVPADTDYRLGLSVSVEETAATLPAH